MRDIVNNAGEWESSSNPLALLRSRLLAPRAAGDATSSAHPFARSMRNGWNSDSTSVPKLVQCAAITDEGIECVSSEQQHI